MTRRFAAGPVVAFATLSLVGCADTATLEPEARGGELASVAEAAEKTQGAQPRIARAHEGTMTPPRFEHRADDGHQPIEEPESYARSRAAFAPKVSSIEASYGRPR
jgi:hypothetical protein